MDIRDRRYNSPFHEFSPRPISNFSRVQSKADFQFLDDLGKRRLETFGSVFLRLPAGSDPHDPPRWPGPAVHRNSHGNSGG